MGASGSGHSGATFGSTEANPLGLSLGFVEGLALVSLRDRTIADGLVIRALDLELVDVTFPLDLKGGAEEFQRRATKLRTLVVELSVEALARSLQAGLTRAGSPITALALRPDDGALALEAELAIHDRRARITGQLALAPAEPREVRLVVSELLELGYFPVSAAQLPAQLTAAIRHVFAPFGERTTETLRRSGASSVGLDVVDALLWALIPQSGWKVPQHADAPLVRLDVRADGVIRLEVGDLSVLGTERGNLSVSGRVAVAPSVLAALARDDAAGLARGADEKLTRGDVAGAFHAMRDRLDASLGPDALLERVLSLGSAEVSLHADTRDLARDQLAKRPDSVPALLALGRIAAYDGDFAQAFESFERAARVLRDAQKKRAAGAAYLAASKAAKAGSTERVRVLEEAIALLPDDVDALNGLVEELPRLGRATAAVRAARRLANLETTTAGRVAAYAAAGDLLREHLADPVQAKREYERALKLAPDDDRANEGLARAIMDQGDPRRAATIFDRLIAKAERAGDKTRAARLSLLLGDLWRTLDPDAAMARYRRAKELAPSDLSVLARLAEVATGAGRGEAALEAIEQSIPLLEAAHGEEARAEALKLRLQAGALLEAQPSRADDAIAHFEAALALAPSSKEALFALAGLYERAGDAKKRARVLTRHAALAAADGDLDTASAQWVTVLDLAGDDRALIAETRRAIAEAPTNRRHAGLLDATITAAEREGDHGAVIEAIDRRLLLDTTDAERAGLLARLGAALEGAGRASEAARAYEEALAKRPDEMRAISALTRLYRERNDGERLASVLDRATRVARTPEDRAQLLGERARLLAATRREGDALDAANRALTEAPESTELLALATELALKLSRFDEARAFAERRLAVLARAPGDTRDLARATHLDLARAAGGLDDRGLVVRALESALALSQLSTPDGRQIAARLARELQLAQRFEELA
ncbi:hypothetical protein L6R52_39185, partial [Myxococcota bacterium]|nr:hypothetical protein [Myxococcota bacterium]